MSRYASHCGRKIVSKQWVYCPYCGEPLAGEEWLSRSPVETVLAEDQTELPDYYAVLPEPVMNWNMKQLRAAAAQLLIKGRSKMTKPELADAIKVASTAFKPDLDHPLFDF